MLNSKRTSALSKVGPCLVAVALFSSAGLAQQPAPQIGGAATLPQGNVGGVHIAGRGLDTGGLVVVPEDFSKLTLAPGFLLNLQVYDMPEINSQLRVDESGNVNLPLAGAVHVAGLTLPQAQTAITKKLVDAEMLQNPEINLDVAQYAGDNVTVLGEVQNPGRVQLLAPHALSDVLAMVGGTTIAAGNQITIRRTVDGRIENEQVSYSRSGNSDDIRNIVVQPRDTITVPRAGIVYVLGGVNRPGGYIMQEDGTLDVAQALSMAYGTTLNAAVGSIRVVRKHSNGTLETIPIFYGKVTSGKEKPMELHAEDIVYVPISKIKSILTAGISAAASSAAIYTVR
jgi:polysaccharide export outer membrane protein